MLVAVFNAKSMGALLPLRSARLAATAADLAQTVQSQGRWEEEEEKEEEEEEEEEGWALEEVGCPKKYNHLKSQASQAFLFTIRSGPLDR